MPPGAVTSRRGARAWRHAAASSRSRLSPSRCPVARAAAATATGGQGGERRQRQQPPGGSNPAQMMAAVVVRMATWRAVSPARILSGRSMSAGIGVLAGCPAAPRPCLAGGWVLPRPARLRRVRLRRVRLGPVRLRVARLARGPGRRGRMGDDAWPRLRRAAAD
jgi:hypothetical protein